MPERDQVRSLDILVPTMYTDTVYLLGAREYV